MNQIFAAVHVIILLTLGSCDFNTGPEGEPPASRSENYLPVFMERSALESAVAFVEPRKVQSSGKLYIYGKYLFLSERYQGIHIYSNEDPTNPKAIGFIVVPGCTEVAVKDNVLYCDSAQDLLCLDIRQPQAVKVLNRYKDVFPEILSPDGDDAFGYDRPENTVVCSWKKL
jgi:hypothetical protein